MDIDKQINLGHLLLNDRKCRVCGEIKNLVDGFYRTRKNRGAVASSYSYECKDCTIKRVIVSRMQTNIFSKWEYPDW
jgi:predicted nucleic acid-binding Zn ribbon protein